jgi:hypothetical protein
MSDSAITKLEVWNFENQCRKNEQKASAYGSQSIARSLFKTNTITYQNVQYLKSELSPFFLALDLG